MADKCDHKKAVISTDSGKKRVCLICDDVSVFMSGEVISHE